MPMSLCCVQYRTYLPGLVNFRVHVPDAWSGDLKRWGPDFTLTIGRGGEQQRAEQAGRRQVAKRHGGEATVAGASRVKNRSAENEKGAHWAPSELPRVRTG